VSRPAVRGFDLERFLRRERERVEKALERALADLLPLLPPAVRGAVRDGVTAGGKRLRPILCLTAYAAAGGRDEAEIPALAVSLELVHAYSLMHDDLPCMDDAPLRRGRPTPHTIHGEEATVRGAAALIPAAHLQAWRAGGAMGLPDEVRRELVATLARASGGDGMVGGQALDLLGEGRSLGREALDGLHRRKTGALLTASLRMGGLAAEASAPALAGLEAYGRAVGLAFQIADDVLDATADADRLGKNPSDAALEKSTYVALLGVEGARAEAAALVETALARLADAGLEAPALEGLARYVVSRDR
jgi:geranylgeranyl pyrophosphate synthase